jgi:hypothetical protein
MWLLRGLLASVLWLVAGLVGLVGVILSVTVVLLPLGIPVLLLAKRIFGYSVTVLVPRKVRHPVAEAGKSTRRGLNRATTRGRGRKRSDKLTRAVSWLLS